MELEEASALADHYAAARRIRLDAQKEVDKLQETENGLKATLMEFMRKTKTSSIGGNTYLVTHRIKPKAVAKDWDQIQKYIIANDAFDIMEMRLSTKAILDRAEQQDHVPGMEWFDVDTLSVAKAKT